MRSSLNLLVFNRCINTTRSEAEDISLVLSVKPSPLSGRKKFVYPSRFFQLV